MKFKLCSSAVVCVGTSDWCSGGDVMWVSACSDVMVLKCSGVAMLMIR